MARGAGRRAIRLRRCPSPGGRSAAGRGAGGGPGRRRRAARDRARARILAGTARAGRPGSGPGLRPRRAERLLPPRPRGAPIGYLHALGRQAAWWLSVLLFGAGFAVAVFRRDHRALHDLLAGTRVVRVVRGFGHSGIMGPK
ncbi:MAG: RDD family protein [Candidatus Rokubacteria bacterium]|nr:RDD family protein [Candidatus Rokubacteria bacterium]